MPSATTQEASPSVVSTTENTAVETPDNVGPLIDRPPSEDPDGEYEDSEDPSDAEGPNTEPEVTQAAPTTTVETTNEQQVTQTTKTSPEAVATEEPSAAPPKTTLAEPQPTPSPEVVALQTNAPTASPERKPQPTPSPKIVVPQTTNSPTASPQTKPDASTFPTSDKLMHPAIAPEDYNDSIWGPLIGSFVAGCLAMGCCRAIYVTFVRQSENFSYQQVYVPRRPYEYTMSLACQQDTLTLCLPYVALFCVQRCQ